MQSIYNTYFKCKRNLNIFSKTDCLSKYGMLTLYIQSMMLTHELHHIMVPAESSATLKLNCCQVACFILCSNIQCIFNINIVTLVNIRHLPRTTVISWWSQSKSIKQQEVKWPSKGLRHKSSGTCTFPKIHCYLIHILKKLNIVVQVMLFVCVGVSHEKKHSSPTV